MENHLSHQEGGDRRDEGGNGIFVAVPIFLNGSPPPSPPPPPSSSPPLPPPPSAVPPSSSSGGGGEVTLKEQVMGLREEREGLTRTMEEREKRLEAQEEEIRDLKDTIAQLQNFVLGGDMEVRLQRRASDLQEQLREEKRHHQQEMTQLRREVRALTSQLNDKDRQLQKYKSDPALSSWGSTGLGKGSAGTFKTSLPDVRKEVAAISVAASVGEKSRSFSSLSDATDDCSSASTGRFDETDRFGETGKLDGSRRYDTADRFDETGKLDGSRRRYNKTDRFDETGNLDGSRRRYDKTDRFDETGRFDKTGKFSDTGRFGKTGRSDNLPEDPKKSLIPARFDSRLATSQTPNTETSIAYTPNRDTSLPYTPDIKTSVPSTNTPPIVHAHTDTHTHTDPAMIQVGSRKPLLMSEEIDAALADDTHTYAVNSWKYVPRGDSSGGSCKTRVKTTVYLELGDYIRGGGGGGGEGQEEEEEEEDVRRSKTTHTDRGHEKSQKGHNTNYKRSTDSGIRHTRTSSTATSAPPPPPPHRPTAPPPPPPGQITRSTTSIRLQNSPQEVRSGEGQAMGSTTWIYQSVEGSGGLLLEEEEGEKWRRGEKEVHRENYEGRKKEGIRETVIAGEKEERGGGGGKYRREEEEEARREENGWRETAIARELKERRRRGEGETRRREENGRRERERGEHHERKERNREWETDRRRDRERRERGDQETNTDTRTTTTTTDIWRRKQQQQQQNSDKWINSQAEILTPPAFNSCISATLRCLHNLPPLRHFFAEVSHRPGGWTDLIMSVSGVFATLESGTEGRSTLGSLLEAAGRRDKTFLLHHDPAPVDFLSSLLIWLHGDLTDHTPLKGPKATSSVVSDLFQGLRESLIVCPMREEVLSAVMESFNFLTLTVPKEGAWTLQEILTRRFQPQHMSWECGMCGVRHLCLHRLHLLQAPRVLVLYLHHASSAAPPTRVLFPEAGLVMSLHHHHHHESQTYRSPEYHLVGVMTRQHTDTPPSTHTAFCRSPSGGSWRVWDGLKAGGEVSRREVLSQQAAHLLFYAQQEESRQQVVGRRW